MAATDDQFFEEEDALEQRAHEAAQAPKGKAARTQARPAPQQAPKVPAAKGARKPPSIGMVIAIAIVAVVLGYALGYFMCLRSTSVTLVNEMSQYTGDSYHSASDGTAAGSAAADAETGSTGGVNDELGLPSGHPDLASLMNADGTLNEEAVAAYKAQLAASSASKE